MKRSVDWSHWNAKFLYAFRGLRIGIVGQSSFVVHFLVTILVVLFAIGFRLSVLEWALLVLCIGVVLSAELFNSALESISRAITLQYDEDIRNALDVASAAVLVVAIAAALAGAMIFLMRLGLMLGWWGSYLIW